MRAVAPYGTLGPRDPERVTAALECSPLGWHFGASGSELTGVLALELGLVWLDFVERLQQVPIVRAMESGTADLEDYRALLRNLRQQVIDGGRWIPQMAASMSQPLFEVRSALIGHAAEEHRDYQLLEQNYLATGGDRRAIESAPKNVGSSALSSYIFHQAAQPDPLHLFGAVFIIEGLGSTKAARWAACLKQQLGLSDDAVSFLAYHGTNDHRHYDKLRAVLSMPAITSRVVPKLVHTARVVGRLYCLQLEELDHV